MESGIEIISKERERQQTEEGRSRAKDLMNNQYDEMAIVAAAYASPARTRKYRTSSRLPLHWPWDSRWWKPTPDDRIRELAKAGALIAAEIDRLQYIQYPVYESAVATTERNQDGLG